MIKITPYAIKKIADKFFQDNFVLHLSSSRDFKSEFQDENYIPIKLSRKDWKLEFNDEKKTVNVHCKWAEWNFSGGGDKEVYGYYITDSDDKVVLTELFLDGPYQILRKGDVVRVRSHFRFAI
jgi:hypothetical protein